MTSDGGGLLLREVDLRLGLLDRIAGCFDDHRNPGSVEHSVRELLAQRIFGVALGYEDLNNHDVLRSDSVLAVLVGKSDVAGSSRVRARDRGCPLSGSSTLNRLELSSPGTAAGDRYKKIAADGAALDKVLVDTFLASYARPPREIWLDLDATDDPLHGCQEGRFFHGYYRCYCYLPLYIFCGEHLLCARLRPSNRDGAAGSVEELQRIVAQIRMRWPKTRIVIRGDSGFCREPILRWCEDNGIDYVLGLARNKRLVRAVAGQMREARAAHGYTGRPGGSAILPTRRVNPGAVGAASSAKPSIWPKVPIHAFRSPACRHIGPVPGACMSSCTAHAVRWRTGSRSSSWGCSPTAPAQPRCGPISCGCTSPLSPTC